MSESLNKVIVPIGVAWVGISLVIGLVIVLSPVAKLSARVRTIEKKIYITKMSGGTAIKTDAEQLGTKVRIQGTIDPNEKGSLGSEVKIK